MAFYSRNTWVRSRQIVNAARTYERTLGLRDKTYGDFAAALRAGDKAKAHRIEKVYRELCHSVQGAYDVLFSVLTEDETVRVDQVLYTISTYKFTDSDKKYIVRINLASHPDLGAVVKPRKPAENGTQVQAQA